MFCSFGEKCGTLLAIAQASCQDNSALFLLNELFLLLLLNCVFFFFKYICLYNYRGNTARESILLFLGTN